MTILIGQYDQKQTVYVDRFFCEPIYFRNIFVERSISFVTETLFFVSFHQERKKYLNRFNFKQKKKCCTNKIFLLKRKEKKTIKENISSLNLISTLADHALMFL